MARRCFHTVRENQLALSRAYITGSGLLYPFNVILRDGRSLAVNDFYDLTTFWLIFMSDTYPLRQDDRVVIDAGANIGAFSLCAARQPGSKVIAIEPFPAHLERSRVEYRALNALPTANMLARARPPMLTFRRSA